MEYNKVLKNKHYDFIYIYMHTLNFYLSSNDESCRFDIILNRCEIPEKNFTVQPTIYSLWPLVSSWKRALALKHFFVAIQDLRLDHCNDSERSKCACDDFSLQRESGISPQSTTKINAMSQIFFFRKRNQS